MPGGFSEDDYGALASDAFLPDEEEAEEAAREADEAYYRNRVARRRRRLGGGYGEDRYGALGDASDPRLAPEASGAAGGFGLGGAPRPADAPPLSDWYDETAPRLRGLDSAPRNAEASLTRDALSSASSSAPSSASSAAASSASRRRPDYRRRDEARRRYEEASSKTPWWTVFKGAGEAYDRHLERLRRDVEMEERSAREDALDFDDRALTPRPERAGPAFRGADGRRYVPVVENGRARAVPLEGEPPSSPELADEFLKEIPGESGLGGLFLTKKGPVLRTIPTEGGFEPRREKPKREKPRGEKPPPEEKDFSDSERRQIAREILRAKETALSEDDFARAAQEILDLNGATVENDLIQKRSYVERTKKSSPRRTAAPLPSPPPPRASSPSAARAPSPAPSPTPAPSASSKKRLRFVRDPATGALVRAS